MSEGKRAKVNRVNNALETNKEAEKMVKQVIENGENVSTQGKAVLKTYMCEVCGLYNLSGKKLEEPININGKQTKEIRDKKN